MLHQVPVAAGVVLHVGRKLTSSLAHKVFLVFYSLHIGPFLGQNIEYGTAQDSYPW